MQQITVIRFGGQFAGVDLVAERVIVGMLQKTVGEITDGLFDGTAQSFTNPRPPESRES